MDEVIGGLRTRGIDMSDEAMEALVNELDEDGDGVVKYKVGCMRVFMHACVCACVCMCACVHVCMCTCVHVCVCACVHVPCLPLLTCALFFCFAGVECVSFECHTATPTSQQGMSTHPSLLFKMQLRCSSLPHPSNNLTYTHSFTHSHTQKHTHTQTDTHTHSHTHKHTLLRVAWFASQAMSAKAEADEDTMKILGKVLRMSFDDFVLVVLYTHYSTRP